MGHALIFDSGVGGLSVVAGIRALMPALKLTYVADDEFRPYGDKSAKALQARLPGLLRTLEYMFEPDIVVVACNTASTTALSEIRDSVSAPVIGVVPAIKPAAKASKSHVIGVLGTPGTIKRHYVDGLIQAFAADCQVHLHGSVELVEMAEAKLAGEAVDMAQLRQAIEPLLNTARKDNMDMIVLACTHFPLLRPELSAVAGPLIGWVDSGAAIARRVQTVMADVIIRRPIAFGANMAFLIGPEPTQARREAFISFGFDPVIALKPLGNRFD